MRRLVLLATILSLTACSGGSSRGPIVLGLAGPFSQSRGVSMQHAAELAVKEINARGGSCGRRGRRTSHLERVARGGARVRRGPAPARDDLTIRVEPRSLRGQS